jgi:hypothetical protein
MEVTIRFADQVRRLSREGMTVAQIATALRRPTADILETLTMLGLPLPGEHIALGLHTLSDEERAALRGKMPKRWQDRRGD